MGQKHEVLQSVIAGFRSVAVAFSGGVDSALVLKVSYDVLGRNAVGVTADSPAVPRGEIEHAKRIAASIGVEHVLLQTGETKDEKYLQNPRNRCYFCKNELYKTLAAFVAERGLQQMANGTNADDLQDYRPGLQAAEQYAVKSPLVDAGLRKANVRALAKQLGLEVWDKPASPCLASRFPQGTLITIDRLRRVEAAEQYVKAFGVHDLRVRYFGTTARIEVRSEDFPVVESNLPEIRRKFQELQFAEVFLSEFRSGVLNLPQ
ncbi:ATP-dependent sacrificial sulfur transferase LarE [Candidatus Woesearchaeota archaeon]|nr:ATP-dependent sacrificial sulfur transferase LarE [Candidatus Woesearchaeota archaeon]